MNFRVWAEPILNMSILRLVNWFAIDPGLVQDGCKRSRGTNSIALLVHLTISKYPFPHKIKHRKIKAALENVSLEALS